MNISKELKDLIMEKSIEISRELYEEETDRGIVGAETTIDLIYEKEIYKLTISAFWEKCNYFDYHITDGKTSRSQVVAGYF